MADEFFLQRYHLSEQVHLPLSILGQGIIHNEKSVVVNPSNLLDSGIYWPRTETTTAKIRYRTRVATIAAASGSVNQIYHLHALVVVQFPLIQIPTSRLNQ